MKKIKKFPPFALGRFLNNGAELPAVAHVEQKGGSIADVLSLHVFAPLIVLILLNIPFWLLERFFFVMRPIFNVDLFVAAVVCMFSLRIGLPLLLCAWVMDGFRVTALSYHFGEAYEFLSSFRFSTTVAWRHLLSPSVLWVALLFLIAGVLATLILRSRRRSIAAMLSWMALICVGDVFNGSTQLFGFGQDSLYIKANLAGSPGWNILTSILEERKHGSVPVRALKVPPQSFEAALKWQAAHPEGSVLVVLVESLGMPRTPVLQSWLAQRLLSQAVESRWAVTSQVERFSGSTTHGELRVLCGLQGHYARLTPESGDKCLPSQLARKGYDTTGMHGFTALMFDRSDWWERIGLHSRLFGEQLLNSGKICGSAFPGVCDRDLISRAVMQADRPQQFVYLLTLNTHLPLSVFPISPELAQLCAVNEVNDLACQSISQEGAVLSALAASLSKMLHPPFVVVVGDHAPPFNRLQDRLAFDQHMVPLFLLAPIE